MRYMRKEISLELVWRLKIYDEAQELYGAECPFCSAEMLCERHISAEEDKWRIVRACSHLLYVNYEAQAAVFGNQDITTLSTQQGAAVELQEAKVKWKVINERGELEFIITGKAMISELLAHCLVCGELLRYNERDLKSRFCEKCGRRYVKLE